MRLTLDIVGKTLFDADVGGDAGVVGDALTAAMRAIMSDINSVVPVPPSWPLPRNLRAKKRIAELDQRDLSDDPRAPRRRERPRRLPLDAADGAGRGRRQPMTDQQVRDEAMTHLPRRPRDDRQRAGLDVLPARPAPRGPRRARARGRRRARRRAPTLEDVPKLPDRARGVQGGDAPLSARVHGRAAARREA